jgi:hydroxymethylbilane synthase
MAGLNRLGLDAVARRAIDPEAMLPAVAQGAIGIERRANDDRAAMMLAAIHDTPTGLRLAAERAFSAVFSRFSRVVSSARSTTSNKRSAVNGFSTKS